jgi:hypothetical protein
MKTLKATFTMILLMYSIGNTGALDTNSAVLIDRLLSLTAPVAPETVEDGVLFTASSGYRRVGVSFAHEGFARIYWFQKLMIPINNPALDAVDAKGKKIATELYHDSGILFTAYTVPEDVLELEYRLVVDGLWTTDPLNPVRRMDPLSGIERSVVIIPAIEKKGGVLTGPAGTLTFSYAASPGETITVAGSFNGWDPFMYELREQSPGQYRLVLPLPQGTYHYVFLEHGERVLDPNNANRVYTREGLVASEAVVR